jgi:DNA-directed RNA polymerase II subunit RPB1
MLIVCSILPHFFKFYNGYLLTLILCFCVVDGDEMNLHIAQGYEAQAEATVLSRVSHMVMSPQGNKPVMGIVQDALCAIRKFTLRDALFDRLKVYNMLMHIPNWDGRVPAPCIVKPRAMWSGKQIFSLILPHYVSYKGRHPYPHDAVGGDMCIHDTSVLIENGELLSGIVCKKAVGSSAGGLVDIIWREGGPDAARNFFDGCQYLMNEYMHHHGFSVGLGDCIITNETEASIAHRVQEAFDSVDDLIKGAIEKAGNVASLSRGDAQTLESSITRTLAKARDMSGTMAADSLPGDNNFKQMVQAGSKGSMINVSQISAVVGQQNVDGGRIGFAMRDRSLPYFERGDVRPSAKGFVAKSYLSGLTPTEFFFHAMGGREGLIDTACRTSETGYLQRKLVKALEDYSVTYDTTVRSSSGSVLQFAYGEDGIDGVFIEKQTVELVRMTDKGVRRLSNIDAEVSQLFADRDYLRKFLPKLESSFHAPLNFRRILKRAQNRTDRRGLPCTTEWTFQRVTKFVHDLKNLSSSFPLFDVLIRFFFASKSIEKLNFSCEDVDWALTEIERRFVRAKVEAGESVGIIAAQSIGEPTTQLTLNSFHASGDVNQLVTSGVGRIKELVNDLKQFKSPSMVIPLLPTHQTPAQAESFAKSILPVFLQDLVIEHSIQQGILPQDLPWTELWQTLCQTTESAAYELSPWTLRMNISREKLFDVGLTMSELCATIEGAYEHDLLCMHSTDNAHDLALYIRFEDDPQKDSKDMNKETIEGIDFLKEVSASLLEHLCLRGIAEVEVAQVNTKEVSVVDPSTGGVVDKSEYFVETIGINMPAVVVLEGVDRKRLYCNDPKDMFQYYGIEAARACLLKEIRLVIEGSYVNYRHLALLCDTMTSKGQLLSVGRHGLNRTSGGPLKRSTFEESVDQLMQSAVQCEVDNLTGVSECIMVGRHIPTGTGACSVFWKADDDVVAC